MVGFSVCNRIVAREWRSLWQFKVAFMIVLCFQFVLWCGIFNFVGWFGACLVAS